MKSTKISILNIVGNALCIEANDGERVFQIIKAAMAEDHAVSVSFLNVEMLTSAFLNTAIGQLYRDFTEPEIEKRIQVVDLQADDSALLKRVIDTAKLFYSDPNRLDESVRSILGDDE